MPKRTDINSIMIIGAGPIVIGQACEFDYSGAQACKALREEGYRVILVNSNPATIMTDPELADATYVEPITPDMVAKIIEVHTIHDQSAVGFLKKLSDVEVEFTFAGVTAVDGIAAVGGIGQLTGRALLMADANPGGLRPCLLEQMGSKRRRHPRHGEGSIPFLLMSDGRHQGAVHTAGVGHTHGVLLREPRSEGLQQFGLAGRQGVLQPEHQRNNSVKLSRLKR